MKRLLFLLLSLRLLAADSLFTANETTAFYNTTNSGTLGAAGTLAVSGGATFATNVTITGPLIRPTSNISTSTTLDRTHYNVMVSDSSADVTITLPAAADYTGHEYRIIKRAGNNRTTIAAQSGELIGGLVNTIPLPLLTSVTLESNGSQWHMVESPMEPVIKDVSVTTNLAVGDFNITVNDTAGSVTLNLPSATNYSLYGRKIYIHKRAGINTTTIDPNGSELIDSDSTLVVPYRGSVVLQSDLTGWRSVGRSFPLSADTLSVTAIELGHASDTTLARSAAGKITVESVPVALVPSTETLAYSSTTVTVTAGKGPNQSSVLTCTNNFTLSFSSVADNDGGTIWVHPAATNCTVTLGSPAYGPSGTTLTITGGTGSTNHTVLAWKATTVNSTNVINVNALNYYR